MAKIYNFPESHGDRQAPAAPVQDRRYLRAATFRFLDSLRIACRRACYGFTTAAFFCFVMALGWPALFATGLFGLCLAALCAYGEARLRGRLYRRHMTPDRHLSEDDMDTITLDHPA